jgi:hypothetical protein
MGIREDAAQSRMKKKVEEGTLSDTRGWGLALAFMLRHSPRFCGENSHAGII